MNMQNITDFKKFKEEFENALEHNTNITKEEKKE